MIIHGRDNKQARDALGSMPAIMTTLSGTAESYQTALGRIQTQIQGGVMGALSSLLPVFDEISQKISSIDFGEIGLNIGAYLRQIWEGGLMGLFNELAARCNIIGVAVWEAIKMAFAPLYKAEAWKPLGLLLGGALMDACGMLSKGFAACVAIITAGIEKAVDYLLKGISYIPGLGDLAPSETKSFGQHYNDAMQGLSWTYQPAIDMANDLIDRGMAGVADAWAGAFDGWGDAVMNSSGAQYLDAMRQERESWKELFLQQARFAEKDARKAAQATPSSEDDGGLSGKAARATSRPAADQWARIGAFAGNGAQAETLNLQRGSYSALKAIQTLAGRIHSRLGRLEPSPTL